MTENPNRAIPATADMPRVTVVKLNLSCRGFPDAMRQADSEASHHLGEHMLLSWYDRERDFESPQYFSECHAESAVPGYVDYGLNHGATLKVDMEDGRFVFFYFPVEL